MTTSHYNTKSISKWLIGSIIHVEHRTPHSRPEIIRSESQEQLKDSRVVVVIEAWSPLAPLVIVTSSYQLLSSGSIPADMLRALDW